MKKINKYFNKNGIAIILTISVLTGISILGISFLALLNRDQKTALSFSESWGAEAAVEAALNTSIWEIKNRLSVDDYYFKSVIETGDPSDAQIPASNIYFKSIIKTTNAKLCIYQSTPEFNNVFGKLKNYLSFSAGVITDFDTVHSELKKDVYRKWNMKLLSEIIKIYSPGAGDTNKMKIYTALLDHVTTYPQNKSEELSVNIIDYGKSFGGGATNELVAEKRDFAPTGDLIALRGAKIKIIAGPGLGEANTIKEVDSVNKNKLILNNQWITSPTDKSFYRIYSYTSPINFNAASKELIQANLEVLRPLYDSWGKYLRAMNYGFYNSTSPGTFLGELYTLRETDKTIIKDFKDFDQSYLNNITVYKDLMLYKTDFIKMFDPKQPKAFYDNVADAWEVYPIPVPFCFESDGHYDIEMTAGIKRNPKAKRAFTNLNRNATVKIFQKKEYSLREDFINDLPSNWISPSDWVPVFNLGDFSDWESSSNSNFRPYWKFTSQNDAPNVFPDSIKNGIWLDFNAEKEKRGSDEVLYSSEFNRIMKASALYQFFSTSDALITQNNTDGKLEVEGDTTPQSTVLFDDGIESKFGDAGIMTEINDEDILFGVFKNPHPTEDADYDTDYADHAFTEHKSIVAFDGITASKSYPSEPYFSPALFIKDDLNENISFQAQYGYDDAGDYVQYSTCTAPDADWCIADSFSVINKDGSFSINADNYESWDNKPYSVYCTNFKLYNLVFKHGSDKRIFLKVKNISHPSEPEIDQGDLENGGALTLDQFQTDPANDFNDFGKIGFRRLFPGQYFFSDPPVPEAKYSIKYLRIIPENGENASNEIILPFYQTEMDIPKARNVLKLRVYYRVGLTNNVDFLTWNKSIDYRYILESEISLDGAPISTNIDTANSLEIDSFDKTYGFVDLNINQSFNAGSSENRKIKLKLEIENTPDNSTEKENFLKTTIAIEKIELFYEVDDNIISVFENY